MWALMDAIKYIKNFLRSFFEQNLLILLNGKEELYQKTKTIFE